MIILRSEEVVMLYYDDNFEKMVWMCDWLEIVVREVDVDLFVLIDVE